MSKFKEGDIVEKNWDGKKAIAIVTETNLPGIIKECFKAKMLHNETNLSLGNNDNKSECVWNLYQPTFEVGDWVERIKDSGDCWDVGTKARVRSINGNVIFIAIDNEYAGATYGDHWVKTTPPESVEGEKSGASRYYERMDRENRVKSGSTGLIDITDYDGSSLTVTGLTVTGTKNCLPEKLIDWITIAKEKKMEKPKTNAEKKACKEAKKQAMADLVAQKQEGYVGAFNIWRATELKARALRKDADEQREVLDLSDAEVKQAVE